MIAYRYVFNTTNRQKKNKMIILISCFNDPNVKQKVIAEIDLDGEEPNWKALDEIE
jgi:hypothetical protein